MRIIKISRIIRHLKIYTLIIFLTLSNDIFAVDFLCSKNNDNLMFCNQDVTVRNKTFKIHVELIQLKKYEFPYKGFVVWGESKLSNQYIKVFSVSFNKESSWIPFSAFSDLTNIKNIKVINSNMGFKISIVGGSSSTAYNADIYFDQDGYLTKRKVYSLSFPEQLYVVSTYSFIKN